MQTDDPAIETCDLRLTSIDNTTLFTGPYPTTQVPVQKGNKTVMVTEVVPGPYVSNFTKLDQWHDVAFFRFGYFNYQKMNLVSMVNPFTNGTWYKVDLIIDWNAQAVTVYVNDTQLASDSFFTNSKTTIATANAIVLYNLTPGGHCWIKQLMACADRCDCNYVIITLCIDT